MVRSPGPINNAPLGLIVAIPVVPVSVSTAPARLQPRGPAARTWVSQACGHDGPEPQTLRYIYSASSRPSQGRPG